MPLRRAELPRHHAGAQAAPRRGRALSEVPSSFAGAAESLWLALAADWPGLSLDILPEADSSNTRLLEAARALRATGAAPAETLAGPHLLVVERQTAGRGRQGRPWQAAAGLDGEAAHRQALSFSLGLRLPEARLGALAPVVGLAVAEALHPALRLKWPNDLWLDGAKLGGVLIETLPADAGWRYAVIGIGLNLRAPAALPEGAWPAIGLDALPEGRWAGGAARAPAVWAALVPGLLAALRRFIAEGWPAFAPAWAARDALRGQTVRVLDGLGREQLRGVAAGLDGQGVFLVHTAAGLQAFPSAEIVSVRPC
ncbi:biotin--[acetyl-CoA-carboxylase] ligase [Aquariibacter albus]|uniref:biotin--[acetyl-CoA-carboxylase] ligase n=1 Tax=Aquariibacter albus TaxID=2759899 RepID=UPI001F3CE85F|nr:biotin--[acetyl-CoA-carboxylase] ligase [Aquariibacter albus]